MASPGAIIRRDRSAVSWLALSATICAMSRKARLDPNQLSEICTTATSAMATTVVPAMMCRMGQARAERGACGMGLLVSFRISAPAAGKEAPAGYFHRMFRLGLYSGPVWKRRLNHAGCGQEREGGFTLTPHPAGRACFFLPD